MTKTVLVVEDNDLNMKLFCDLLEAHGYTTIPTRDGRGVVELVRERRPDLVLMDIQLPGINGIEALRQVRADPACARIPIVAFTASVMQADRSEISAAGFDGFIGKPINLKEFLETVRRTLEAGRP